MARIVLVSASMLALSCWASLFSTRDTMLEPSEAVSYTLQLLYKYTYWCGATVISEAWAVTAAHCTAGLPQDHFKVRGGSLARNVGGFLMGLRRIVEHHGFRRYSVSCNASQDVPFAVHDISLLNVERPLYTFRGFHMKAALIPLRNPQDTLIEFTGSLQVWRKAGPRQGSTSVFQQLGVSILPDAFCEHRFELLHHTMFCGHFSQGEPLAGDRNYGAAALIGKILVGVLSSSADCRTGAHWLLFTKVNSYTQWIADTLSDTP